MGPAHDSEPVQGPDNRPAEPIPGLTQRRWRIAGGITVGICALMAYFGADQPFLRESKTIFLIYWGIFVVLFIVTLYIVALDIRFIRVQHSVAERDLFQETLGDKEFREALQEAVRNASQQTSGAENRPSKAPPRS